MTCNHALYRVFFLGPTRTISQILMTVGQKNPHVTMELDDINCQCFDGKPIVFFAKSNHLEPTMSIQTPLRWRWHRNVAPPPHQYLCVAALAAVSVGSVVLVKQMQWMQNWNLMPIVSMPRIEVDRVLLELLFWRCRRRCWRLCCARNAKNDACVAWKILRKLVVP